MTVSLDLSFKYWVLVEYEIMPKLEGDTAGLAIRQPVFIHPDGDLSAGSEA
jgi:hypothetical protein